MFYETLEINVETQPNIEDMPPFIFDIFDQDTMYSDFIARCTVQVKDSHYSLDDNIPEPKWHPCRLKTNSPKSGELLVSFSIVESDFNFKTPLNYLRLDRMVETAEYQIDLNILGLRDLQSVGLLPVKKAFIVFNLKSLIPSTDGRALENVRT